MCNPVDREVSVSVDVFVFWQEVVSVHIAEVSDDSLAFVCNTQ